LGPPASGIGKIKTGRFFGQRKGEKMSALIKSKEALWEWKAKKGYEKKYSRYEDFEKAYLAGEITATEPTLPGTSGPTPEQAAAMVEVARIKAELLADPLAREKSMWDDNPAFREEFKSFNVFIAYHRAHTSGRCKIHGRRPTNG
jgi:hypothetical protein